MTRLHTTGKLVYDPYRANMRSDWWCVVVLRDDLARYYHNWVKTRYVGRTINNDRWLCEPSWGAHVSVVRGERPRSDFRSLWGDGAGTLVDLEYDPYPRQAGADKDHFWYIDVYSTRLVKIREALGLRTHYKFHLTIGRTR